MFHIESPHSNGEKEKISSLAIEIKINDIYPLTRQEYLSHQNRVGSELLLPLIKRDIFFIAKLTATECTEL